MLKKVGHLITKDKPSPEKTATTHLLQNQQIMDPRMMALQIELKKFLKFSNINQSLINQNTPK